MTELPHIAIFASGNGSNAQRIAEYFSGKNVLEISGIYCNNPSAYVNERAAKLAIPSILFNREEWKYSRKVLDDLLSKKTDWIILAGFLWLIPEYLLKAFPDRIINIHPALLPKYGGKGMYGSIVHESVLKAGEKFSGITIHYVNEKYDEGRVIFQARCDISELESPESLAQKIHKLEYEHYPRVIEELVMKGM